MDRTLIVLPTYNEAKNIPQLVAELRKAVPDADLLIVDDASPDGTGAVADGLAARDPKVKAAHRSGKLGLGTAHVFGLDAAVEGGYRYVCTMDCDFTHKPEDVPRLLAKIQETGADLVIGSRYSHPHGIADWPLWRRGVTRTAHFLTQTLLGIPHDATNAFRVFQVESLRRVPYREVKGDGYSFMFELVFACLQAGLRVVEVPVELPVRQFGDSKISKAEILKAILALMRLSVLRVTSPRRPAPEALPKR